MRFRALGVGGPEVSVVGLGCNNFGRGVDERGTRSVVDAALDAGVTLFDTADVYGDFGDSERFLGAALRGRRDGVLIATKFGGTGGRTDVPTTRGSREYVRRAVDASLERLATDRIDLYQYHHPDGVTPIEETLGALNELLDEGKVRYIGSSNFNAEQVDGADRIARQNGWVGFVSAQNEYSLLSREAEQALLPTCERLGLGFIPYFPLASGYLTGKYRRGERFPAGSKHEGREATVPTEVFAVVEALERYGAERGRTLLEVAIGCLVARPPVASVIAGATTPDQVRANAAAGDWEPTEADLEELSAVLDRVGAVPSWR